MRRLVTAIIHHRVIISSVLLFSLLFAGPGFALNLSEAQKLLASDGAAGDQFGVQVAIDGDTAVVGAMQDDDRGTNSGSVYVFKRTEGTWFEHQKLTASDGAAGDWFGIAIAIDGDTLAIGAQYDDDMVSNSGSVYIFTRTADSWIETQKLTASDGAPDDLFGGESTIALEGDTLLIGAFDDDDLGDNSGAVYVFTRAAGIWTQQQKLTGSDGGFRDCFGFPTRMDGNNAVIGAPCGDIAEAYVFTRTDGIWAEQQKLTASDGMIGNAFGDGVAINGHTIVIGDDNADDKGMATEQ